MRQKGLNEKELQVAKKWFTWFIRESFSGKDYYNNDIQAWIKDDSLVPSWKHLTRGGHQYGAPLQRKMWGKLIDEDLLFRRVSNKRVFGVQRKSTVEALEGQDLKTKCPCKQCLGGRKTKNLLKSDDYIEIASFGFI